MANLKTRFAGLDLENPLIISSAGITENVEKLRRCQRYGAAAAVMKSYFEEEICRNDPSPRYRIIEHGMGKDETLTFMSYEQASDWDIDRYAGEVAAAKAELDMKIIPSINCITREGWVEAALKVADAGADAIEMNTSCPHGSITFRGGAVEEVIFDTVRAVREAVDLPLIAKISPMLTSPIGVVKGVADLGVNAVTIFNRMTGLEVDLDSESPVMHGGYAGHGGPWAIQYPLRWISQISPQIDIDIAGSGGVVSGEDAVKYLLAGARAVQVCSAVVLNGYEVIAEIIDGIEQWMERKNYVRIGEFRGNAAAKVRGTEEIERGQKILAEIHNETHAPCVNSCPAHVPAQAYVHLIGKRDFAGAVQAIRSANPLQSVCGWVCYHPCEDACTRGDMDSPIAIRALKRFALEWGGRNIPAEELELPAPSPTGKKVAVIGAGPAGLTAAYDLARAGHDVTILERTSAPGGMLRWFIPIYRLPEEVLNAEIALIERAGVKISCNQCLGRDFSLQDVASEHDAVALAFGADKSARLGIKGEDAHGVSGALQFLERVAKGQQTKTGQRVAVIGGGGSALDAARTALRLGSEEVYLLYRRTREEMPINNEEIELAEQEGVRILYLVSPTEVMVENGRVRGLKLKGAYLDTRSVGGRRSPVGVEDLQYAMDFDQVLVAVSQTPDEGAVGSRDGVELTARGGVKVHDQFGTTTREDVFGAGDVTGETGSVIEAIAAGRKAALGVDAYLKGQGPAGAAENWIKSVPVDKKKVLARSIAEPVQERIITPLRPVAERVRDFEPVELSLGEDDAVREADRCLRCGCGVGCGLCQRICPYDAIDLQGTSYVVDEEKCKGCGLCIERCPIENIDLKPL